MIDNIKRDDPELSGWIQKELQRQRNGLEMIPSENFTSLAVMEASGSILTNKYSEGYPGRRYYGGNEFIDEIESLAVERAKNLFGVPYVNVQPYSGSPANLAVYFSVCNPGDTIMGLDLNDGGHLTHGWKTSLTGEVFNSVPYHLNDKEYIDIDEVKRLAEENRPKLIWIGTTAYSRKLPFKEFSEIADSVGAYLAADISHVTGLVVAGVHESPVDYAHIITTTTHKTLRGPRGAMIMVTQRGIDKDPELCSKMDKTIIPGMQGGPHNHTTAGIAVALLEASKPEFKEYGKQIVKNSKALAEEFSRQGIRVVSGGTDNHLLLIDLTQFGNGKGAFAQIALDEAGITVNKNTIPKEPSSSFYPSGIRLGTPALTTRGMEEKEMEEIAIIISNIVKEIARYELPSEKHERKEYIKRFKNEIRECAAVIDAKKRVEDICSKFPLYPELGY